MEIQMALSTQGFSVQWEMQVRYVAIVTHLCDGYEALSVLECEQLIGGGREMWQYEWLASVTNGCSCRMAVGCRVAAMATGEKPCHKGKWPRYAHAGPQLGFKTSNHPPHANPMACFCLHLSASEDQCLEPIGRRQKWWKDSINITEIPDGSAPWHVWQWMGHDAWRPTESCHP